MTRQLPTGTGFAGACRRGVRAPCHGRVMEFSKETMDEAKRHLTGIADYAPHQVFAAMLRLQHPDAVRAAACAQSREAELVIWRVLWVTPTHVVSCESSAEAATWSLSNPVGVATVDAVRVKLEDVEIRITGANLTYEFNTWQADVEASLSLAADLEVTVPLFGGLPHYSQRDQCEAVISALLE